MLYEPYITELMPTPIEGMYKHNTILVEEKMTTNLNEVLDLT